jgi:hypothetical protein
VTWDEHSLRASENRVPRGVSGPEREDVTGGWRHLGNEELHDFHMLFTVIRYKRTRWAGLVGGMTEITSA